MVRVMVFNATFNNISVLFVEETEVPRENHRPVAQRTVKKGTSNMFAWKLEIKKTNEHVYHLDCDKVCQ
jgi:hypothetical protein